MIRTLTDRGQDIVDLVLPILVLLVRYRSRMGQRPVAVDCRASQLRRL